MRNKLTTLFPYQKEDSHEIKKLGGRVLLASEMGTGKTLIVLSTLLRNPDWLPALVICPASVKYSWQYEAAHHVGLESSVCAGQKPPVFNRRDFSTLSPLTIINYDVLRFWVKYLKKLNFKTIVIDESQYLGNPRRKRTKAVKDVAAGRQHVIALSGTPLTNRPAELFPTINLLWPDTFPSFYSYAQRYCDPKWTPYGRFDYSGSANLPELHTKLRTCFPAGTMVRSKELGDVPIEDIVNNRLPIHVASFNFKSSTIQWRPVVAYSKRITTSGLVRIVHQFGEFQCTPDHRIWTEAGWVRASSLVPGLCLSTLPEEDKAAGERENYQHEVLLPALCRKPSRTYRRVEVENERNSMGGAGRGADPEEMQTMLETVQTDRYTQNEKSSCILFNFMRCDSSGITTRGQRTRRVKNLDLWLVQNNTFQKNVASDSHTNTVLFNSMRRKAPMVEVQGQRAYSQILEDISNSTNAAWGIGLAGQLFRGPCNDSSCIREIPEGGSLLHKSRFSPARDKVSHRNRWASSQNKTTKKPRQVEGKSVNHSRVVSVEILQPRSSRAATTGSEKNQTEVYDIEVEGNHNFFADEILVHNCGMIRRRKVDVLQDLPDQVRCVIPCELSRPEEYEHANKNFMDWLRENHGHKVRAVSRAEGLAKVGYLLRLVAKLKLRAVVNWANRFLSETDEKLIMFAVHKKCISALRRQIPVKSVTIDGSVTGRMRYVAVEQFQKDPKTRLCLGNIQAAGVGLTLTAASTSAFTEIWWKPGAHIQAEKRTDRIGQTRKSWVNYLIAPQTIEEKLCQLLQKKQKVISAVLDGGSTPQDLNIYDELLTILEGRIL